MALRTTTIIAAILTGVLAAARPARADDDKNTAVAPLAPAVEQEKYWYGWQIIMADAAVVLGTVGFGLAAVDTASAFCAFSYWVAAPTVHVAHDRINQAWGSVGLRLGLPAAGALVGVVLIADCPTGPGSERDYCGVPEVLIGALIGFVAASAVDAVALSTEVIEKPASVRPSGLSFLSPTLSAGPNSASFGLRGSF